MRNKFITCSFCVIAFVFGGAISWGAENPLLALTPYRNKVIALTSATGAFSGVVLDKEGGLIATSSSRIIGAGEITASRFYLKQTGENHYEVFKAPLGVAEVVAIHAKYDAAILRIPHWKNAEVFIQSVEEILPNSAVDVVALMGPVRVDQMIDVDKWAGLLGEGLREGLILKKGAITANASGGAVINKNNELVGICAFSPNKKIGGYVVALKVFNELLRGESKLPDAQKAAWLKPRAGLPPFIENVELELKGKFAKIGRGVEACLDSRTVVLSGHIVRDSATVLEYLACPIEGGKLHETIFAMDGAPESVHFALLALGYEPGGVERTPQKISFSGAELKLYLRWSEAEACAISEYVGNIFPAWERPGWMGVRELINEGEIRWKKDGRMLSVRAEDLLFNRSRGRVMQNTPWIFNGSYVLDGKKNRHDNLEVNYDLEPQFAATVEGVLVAVYNDTAAFANLPLQDANDDMTYVTRDTVLPPLGTSCQLIVRPK